VNIYLAARYQRHKEMQDVRNVLEGLGHRVTSRWIDLHCDTPGDFTKSFTKEFLNTYPKNCTFIGERDIEDLNKADIIISFTEEDGSGGKGGRHVEFGYALARGKRLIIVGPRENVFHTLSAIEHYDTPKDLFTKGNL
jgi:nucleoside 2-deoxyribosyltransferase